MLNFLHAIIQYQFMIRALEAGMIVALLAPLIGVFLVLRRYALIADTLAHVSLAGVALGFLFGFNPIITALATTLAASWGIDYLRTSQKIYGESALAIFLAGALALATVLLGLSHRLNNNLLNYLFGSLATVTTSDIWLMLGLALFVFVMLGIIFKELVYVSFDEEGARVSGLPVRLINLMIVVLAALVVAAAIPVVGVLLISALLVLPAIIALQLRLNLRWTILVAEAVSVFSVLSGLILSFCLNLATGGTIVLVMIFLLGFTLLFKQ